jgi:hypothetical protein
MYIARGFTIYTPFLLLLAAAASFPAPSVSTISSSIKDCPHASLLKRGAALSCFKNPLDPPSEPSPVRISQPPAEPLHPPPAEPTPQPSTFPPPQPSTAPASHPPAPPPAQIPGPPSLATSQLTCTLPADLARYTPDCYCTSTLTIKCDKRLAQMQRILLDLRYAPLRAIWKALQMVQVLEERARRVCHCERALARIQERQHLGRGVREAARWKV